MDFSKKRALLKEYWYNTVSYQSLSEWLEIYSHEEIGGYISYTKAGRKDYIVVWDPICDEKDIMNLIQDFRIFILQKKGRILFISVSQKYKRIYEIMGFWVLEIWQEALFDIQNFTLEGKERKDFRNMVRRAEKEGVSIRKIEKMTKIEKKKIELLNSDWLTTRKTKGFSFLLKLTPFENLEDKILFVAEKEGAIVGYISAVPIYGRKGYYFEDIIRSSDAPLGTNQLLVLSALEYLKKQGYEVASLGTAPLWNIEHSDLNTHTKTKKLLTFIYKNVHGFYNFQWLYHFKKNLIPTSWEPKFIAYYPAKLKPRVFLSIAKAYNPRGLKGIVMSWIWKTVFPKK